MITMIADFNISSGGSRGGGGVGACPPPPIIPWGIEKMLKGVCANLNQVLTVIVASGNILMGGAILNPKYNPGLDFHSGFRKTSQGGGGAI